MFIYFNIPNFLKESNVYEAQKGIRERMIKANNGPFQSLEDFLFDLIIL